MANVFAISLSRGESVSPVSLPLHQHPAFRIYRSIQVGTRHNILFSFTTAYTTVVFSEKRLSWICVKIGHNYWQTTIDKALVVWCAFGYFSSIMDVVVKEVI